MCDIYKVFYRFKENYKNILKEQYNCYDDKLYYVDILEYNNNYKKFIQKLFYILSNYINMKEIDFLQITALLTSKKVIDRLNGLKRCKNIIKIST